MGNWHISIQGTGSHGNDVAHDADKLGVKFVRLLRDAGHDVETAVFTSGSALDLSEAEAESGDEAEAPA
jgi:hypothetical protein